MQSHTKMLAGAAATFALCVSPTIATAATTPAVQPVSPLVAVSVFGTQTSAQIVCSQGAAGAAAAAQGQAGCVLPAIDVPPPVSQGVSPPPPPPGGGFNVGWLIAGLDAILVIAGLSTLLDDDDDDDDEISPS